MSEERISVSRDALRADLAEMELRLRSFIQVELDKKAAASTVEALAQNLQSLREVALIRTGPLAEAVGEWEQGNLSKAQHLAVEEVVNEMLNERLRSAWLLRSNKAAVLMGIVAILSLLFSLFFTATRVWI